MADAFCLPEKRFKGQYYSSGILHSKVDGKSLSIYSIPYVLYWIIRFVLEYSISCKRTENWKHFSLYDAGFVTNDLLHADL